MADPERGRPTRRARDPVPDPDPDPAAALGSRYLIRFEEDTLRSRPLWIRVIIEFAGTFLLVTVAAGAGVISFYAGGHPISRLIGLVRGLPNKAETEAAEGGALPG